MELPLLTMHMRRIGRRSAVRTLLLGLGTAIASCVMIVGIDVGWGEIAYLVVTLILHFLLMYFVAEHSCSLARSSQGEQPEWHYSTYSSDGMLNGGLWSALLTSLPPALCIIYIEIMASYAMFFENSWVFVSLLQRILVLPHFALFALCCALAMRRSGLGGYLPVLLAVSGTAGSAWAADLMENSLTWLGGWAGAVGFILAGIAIALIFQLASIRISEQESAELWQIIPLLGWLMLPIAVGTAAALSRFGISQYYWMIPDELNALLYGHYSLVFPSLTTITIPDSYFYYWNQNAAVWHRVEFLQLELPTAGAILMVLVIQSITLCLWYVAALRCLDAARNPALAWINHLPSGTIDRLRNLLRSLTRQS